jgi:hypothetical protein
MKPKKNNTTCKYKKYEFFLDVNSSNKLLAFSLFVPFKVFSIFSKKLIVFWLAEKTTNGEHMLR